MSEGLLVSNELGGEDVSKSGSRSFLPRGRAAKPSNGTRSLDEIHRRDRRRRTQTGSKSRASDLSSDEMVVLFWPVMLKSSQASLSNDSDPGRSASLRSTAFWRLLRQRKKVMNTCSVKESSKPRLERKANVQINSKIYQSSGREISCLESGGRCRRLDQRPAGAS